MPKPKYETPHFALNELRNQMIDRAGFPLRTKLDAGYLSFIMKNAGIENVSDSTLYRFFTANLNEHKFYLNTLDKLAQFCGRKNFDDFEKWAANKMDFGFTYGQLIINQKPVKSLIKICIHQNQFNPIREYLEQLNELNNYMQLQIGFEFYQTLLSNPNSNVQFYKEFSQLPVIRESFFEKCIDPEFKIPGYEKGLEFYLKNIDKKNDINYFQDFIFGNCMLFRFHYINNNQLDAIKFSKSIFENETYTDAELNMLFIYPRMRYLSYKIWYLMLSKSKNEVEEYTNWLLHYCEKNIKNWDNTEQRIAFSCVAETFVYGNINLKYHQLLKNIFCKLIASYSPDFSKHSLKYMIPYTDMNGIYNSKRIAKISLFNY